MGQRPEHSQADSRYIGGSERNWIFNDLEDDSRLLVSWELEDESVWLRVVPAVDQAYLRGV